MLLSVCRVPNLQADPFVVIVLLALADDTRSALAKAGYSVLQLDSHTYYGDEWASLTVDELAERSPSGPGNVPEDLMRKSNRFSLSLRPCLLRAIGPAIDVLVRSKVASYLSFGLVAGTAICRPEGSNVHVDRVPSSKSDVFNDPSLSLVEKRRLTKLLLFAAGDEPLGQSAALSDDSTLLQYLSQHYSLTEKVIPALAYALCLASTPHGKAISYGPSPYLVGHYGGAGDLVGGFSRICAVWGGGQILGREIDGIVFDAERGRPVPQAQGLFVPPESLPSKPPPVTSVTESALGIPVVIEPGQGPTLLTADWIGVASSHASRLLGSRVQRGQARAIRAVAVLSDAIPFPSPHDTPEKDADLPDSHMFVFAPGAFSDELGTVTALQVGPGTFASPDGYHVLYLHAPIDATDFDVADRVENLLSPYLFALLSLSHTTGDGVNPLKWVVYEAKEAAPTIDSSGLPQNLVVIPPIEESLTANLCTALDDAVEAAEDLFWRIVGDTGRREGVQFFAPEPHKDGDDDD
ncbi:hypothetical protein OIV83_000341 [Microbotryomycetes sp. JL201]|nr:hypothetical protein OIV83_000341 [Microbotryomycetes sp. JL201]